MYPHSADKPTLYNARICPFAHRAVLALREANVQYEQIDIDLENKPEWYSQVNPLLKVPTLRLPTGEILVESMLIAEYVADQYPESNLMPKSAFDRYRVRLHIDYFGNNVLGLPFKLLGVNSNEAARQELYPTIVERLRELDARLVEASVSGPFFLGDRYSVADIATITFIERLEVALKLSEMSIADTTGLDRLNQWKSAVRSRPSYTKTVASVRLHIDYFGNNVLGLPFKLLGVNSNEAARQELYPTIVERLRELDARLVEASVSGPFFLGDRYSVADIATITFIERLEVALKLSEMSIADTTGLDRFNQWKSAVRSRPSYTETVASYDEIVAAFKKFIK
ncbi:Glutathione S-transferase omega-1 [Smittium culicis]|uniref:Glutathione S-transferase omega-1 n=1 Tax=Smittium culicis TaxID=133412 RepID=A0A1R1YQ09_9FUNG|nr:Glutathione S-transferase omega-1 [Smittium culicis]